MGYRYLFEIVIFFPVCINSEVELLNHMVVLFLIFWGTAILFPIMAVTPIVHKNSFFSLSMPTLISCHFDNSHCNRYEVLSHCDFLFAFPWWLVMVRWPFECLLWRDVYLCPLLIFFSYYWVYILDVKFFLDMSLVDIFSHPTDCLFIYLMVPFAVQKHF